MFLEGSEKKLEIVIEPTDFSLRSLDRKIWDKVVRAAGAEIISSINNDRITAYLLSESSLFVFDHKVVMLTCGKTRLVDSVVEIAHHLRGQNIKSVIYERKNEIFPNFQYSHFFEDVKLLNKLFPGRAYRFGQEDGHHVFLFHTDQPFSPEPEESTLEILMYGLNGPARKTICEKGFDRQLLLQVTGLDKILPGFKYEDHAIEPCGYSLNAIRENYYYTIHVTPEKLGSYASFETNYPIEDIGSIKDKLLNIFKPSSYDVILFDQKQRILPEDREFVLQSETVERLNCGYQVRYLTFYKPARAPRPAFELTDMFNV